VYANWRPLPQHQIAVPGYACPSDPLVPMSTCSAPFGHGFWFGPVTGAVSSYYGSAGPASTHVWIEVGCGLCTPAQTNCLCTDQESAHFGSSTPGGGSGMFSMRPTAVKIAHVSDGTSNTLLVGETVNTKDPVAGIPYHTNDWMDAWCIMSTVYGINTPNLGEYYAAEGFASYHPRGAHFLLVDGSVHFVSETIDLFLLSYLGTKGGGDIVSEF